MDVIEMINELKKMEESTRIQRNDYVPPKTMATKRYGRSQLGHNTLYHHQRLPTHMRRPGSALESKLYKNKFVNN